MGKRDAAVLALGGKPVIRLVGGDLQDALKHFRG
jgi:hypothetical protein